MESKRPMWDPFGSMPALRPWIWLALAALAVVIQGQNFAASLRPEPLKGNDFFQEWAGAKNWFGGHRLYEPFHLTASRYLPQENLNVEILYNAHPPTTVWFALPLAGLSYPDAGLVWNLALLAVLVACVVIVCREVGIGLVWWGFAPFVVILLLYNPCRQHFGLGQINLLMTLAIVFAWRAGRHGHETWVGVWLGLASGVKLLPLFLLGVAALMGRWRVVLGGVLAFAVWCGLTWLLVGTEPFVDYVQTVVPALNGITRSMWLNCSLPSLWAKLFNPNPLDHIVPLVASPILDAVFRWTSSALLIAALVLLLRSRPGRTTPYDLALSLTTMVLVSPICYDTYVLILLPGLLLVWREMPAHGGWPALLLAVSLGVFAIEAEPLFSLIPGGQAGTAVPWQTLTVLAVRTYALLLLWFGLFALAWRARETG